MALEVGAVHVREQLGDLAGGDEPPDDQVAVRAVADVLVDGDHGIDRTSGRYRSTTATVRMMVSEIDVSVGAVDLSAGRHARPAATARPPARARPQRLGDAWVDEELRRIEVGEVGLLRPGTASASRSTPTCRPATRGCSSAAPTSTPPGCRTRCRSPPALEALVREAVAAQAGPPELLAHLAAAALWRYAAEAARGAGSVGMLSSRPVDDARRHIHAHLADPGLTLADIAATAHVTPRAPRARLPRRAWHDADGLPVGAPRGPRRRPPHPHRSPAQGGGGALRLPHHPSLLASRPRRDRASARRAAAGALGRLARPPQPRVAKYVAAISRTATSVTRVAVSPASVNDSENA